MPTFLITGATGTVGAEVIRQLHPLDDVEVRALTRRPDTAVFPTGVRVHGGDLDDPAGLVDALHGVDAVLLLCTGPTAEVMEMITGAGVERVVLLSSATAALADDPGGRRHREAELAVERSDVTWTHLRPGMFATNLLDWADEVRDGVVRQPYAAAAQAPVHERDVAEVAVAALTGRIDGGSAPVLTGPALLTKPEQVAAISAGTGRPLRFDELSPADWRTHTSAFLPAEVTEWLLAYWESLLARPEITTTAVADILGRPARSLEQWAQDHRAAFS